MNFKYLIAGVIVVSLLGLAFKALRSTMTPYIAIKEAKMTKSQCQVKGVVVPGSAVFDMDENIFRFKIEDEQQDVVQVVFDGIKPGNFDQAKEVVVIGKYNGNHFEATQILVKCPSKYEAEGVDV